MTIAKLAILGVALLLAALVAFAASSGARRRDADQPTEGPDR